MPKHGKEWENYFKKLKNSENDANIEFIFYQIKPNLFFHMWLAILYDFGKVNS
jgi:abortive infection bacteriophage resistance protein